MLSAPGSRGGNPGRVLHPFSLYKDAVAVRIRLAQDPLSRFEPFRAVSPDDRPFQCFALGRIQPAVTVFIGRRE